jgi:hypothetical protein
VDDAKRTKIEEFEGDVLINIEKLFEGKITGVSLAKLYCSSIHDDRAANAEDDSRTCMLILTKPTYVH